jgi:GWxTD domain-containing protein
MKRTPLLLVVAVLLGSSSLFAQVSPKYQAWGDTAVRYLMTKQEKTDWAALKSDADAERFIELFWARRDPTPDTPPNELRQQLENRMAEADKRFGSGKTPGSQTDHGLVYVLLGEPSQIVNGVTQPQRFVSTMTQFQRPVNVETWIYKTEAAERVPGTKNFDIAFVFHDEKVATEFELDGQSELSFESTALAVARSVLKRPFLTAADLASKADPGRTVALRMIVVADAATANDILRRAQEGENFAELARKFSSHHSAQQGGYLGRIAFADLDDDIKSAFADKQPGATALITRKPLFAIVRLLTDAEAAAADAEIAKP